MGREGNWYAEVKIGTPEQEVEVDLDMLTADWWVFGTGSGRGRGVREGESGSYGELKSGWVWILEG